VEFAYNNHIHSSTQQMPCLLDTGRHPQMGFEPHQPPSRVKAVNEFTDRMKSTLEEARSVLAKAKDDMARYYNQRRAPAPTFAPGNKVYLDSSDIHTTHPSRKLSHRRLGPYRVERRIGRYAYRSHSLSHWVDAHLEGGVIVRGTPFPYAHHRLCSRTRHLMFNDPRTFCLCSCTCRLVFNNPWTFHLWSTARRSTASDLRTFSDLGPFSLPLRVSDT